jgi:hypothetical protein
VRCEAGCGPTLSARYARRLTPLSFGLANAGRIRQPAGFGVVTRGLPAWRVLSAREVLPVVYSADSFRKLHTSPSERAPAARAARGLRHDGPLPSLPPATPAPAGHRVPQDGGWACERRQAADGKVTDMNVIATVDRSFWRLLLPSFPAPMSSRRRRGGWRGRKGPRVRRRERAACAAGARPDFRFSNLRREPTGDALWGGVLQRQDPPRRKPAGRLAGRQDPPRRKPAGRQTESPRVA